MTNGNHRRFRPRRLRLWRSRRSLMIFFAVLGAVVLPLLLASCAEPSPLYGTWSDNWGNTFTFFEDDTFNAKVVSSSGASVRNYSGKYTVLMNVLTLDCDEISLRIVTEWDIRGNIMYLNWITAEDGAMSLTLFKTSN